MGKHVMERATKREKVNTDYTREEWVEAVTRSFARSGPDMYPTGFFAYVAEDLANKGAYDKYVYGEYPPGKLYVPEGD